jgi:hypothetical protein
MQTNVNADDSTQFHTDYLPAPSVADLERWFDEDVAEFKRKHKRSNVQPVPCEIAFGVWTEPDKTADALSNTAPPSTPDEAAPSADVPTISPPAENRPDEQQGIVSLSTPSRMIETIYIPNSHALALAVYSPAKKTVEYLNRVLARKSPDKKKQGDVYYVPVGSKFDLPGRGAILLPREAASYGSQADLVASIKRFIHRYADLPEFWEDLSAHYVLMTWMYDRFSAVPYLRFLGEPGTGKTRALQVVGALASFHQSFTKKLANCAISYSNGGSTISTGSNSTTRSCARSTPGLVRSVRRSSLWRRTNVFAQNW